MAEQSWIVCRVSPSKWPFISSKLVVIHIPHAQCGKLRETWTDKNSCPQTSGYNNKLIKERKTNREEITIKYRNYHISLRDFAMTDKVNELYLGTVKWIFVENLIPFLLDKYTCNKLLRFVERAPWFRIIQYLIRMVKWLFLIFEKTILCHH